MCLTQTTIRGLDRYNWEGDEIIPGSTVPPSRPVAGIPRERYYPIDVREFLVTDRNELVRKTVRETIRDHVQNRLKGTWSVFQSRLPGSFDFRANAIVSYVSENIGYQSRSAGKPWLFPDETLCVKEGDCEDRAFLAASLMLASGISGYNIRVALGKVKVFENSSMIKSYDHMWVMYKNERGRWMLIEPLHMLKSPGGHNGKSGRLLAGRSIGTSYVPYYVFNNTHLWKIRNTEQAESFHERVGKAWSKPEPSFMGEVHKTILNNALRNVAPQWSIDGLNRYFTRIGRIGPVGDDADDLLNHSYDPRDHFDNGLIKEGWGLVKERLKQFHANNHDLESFAYAAHGISDFYAHTSYVHFAKLKYASSPTGYAVPYSSNDPGTGLSSPPDYSGGSTFDLTTDRFSVNPHYWKGPKNSVPKLWNGEILSGRYAQMKDSHGFLERLMNIPDEMLTAPDFYKCWSLPHHDEIAVDEERLSNGHKLYTGTRTSDTDRLSYENQFRWRKNAAVNHIRQAFQENWQLGSWREGA